METRIPRPLPVLVADNDERTARLLSGKLAAMGYRPILCLDGSALSHALEAHAVSVLFLDLNFDGVEGLAWIGELCFWARSTHRSLSVVAMSAVVGSGVPDAAKRAGARSYVSQPVAGKELLSVMAEAIRDLHEQLGESDPVSRAWQEDGDRLPVHGLAGQDGKDGLAIESGIPDSLFSHLQVLDIDVVLDTVPPLPGVLSLFAPDRHPLFVEWCENLRDRLRDVAEAVSLRAAELSGWFTVLPTRDRYQEQKVLDRLVNAWGAQPTLMNGWRELHDSDTHRGKALDPGRVTEYGSSPDSRLIDKLRGIFAEHPTDPETLEWLAFTLYSNGLLDEAIICYLRLINMHEDRDEHYFYCGNAFFKIGDFERASQMWRVAIGRSPESRMATKARARLDAMAQQEGTARVH